MKLSQLAKCWPKMVFVFVTFCAVRICASDHLSINTENKQIYTIETSNKAYKLLAVLESSGKFGVNFQQKISLFEEKPSNVLIYSEKTKDPLRAIEYLPNLTHSEIVNGDIITAISFMRLCDGNDPWELVMIVIYNKSYYIVKSVINFNEETGKNEMGYLEIDSRIPKNLQNFIRNDWNILVKNYQQESKRVEADWKKRGYDLPVGQIAK